MAKKKIQKIASEPVHAAPQMPPVPTLANLDPNLSALFTSSIPRASSKIVELTDRFTGPRTGVKGENLKDAGIESPLESSDAESVAESDVKHSTSQQVPIQDSRSRKRKRRDPEEDVEERYMKRLAAEQDEDASDRSSMTSENDASSSPVEAELTQEVPSAGTFNDDGGYYEIPKHESLGSQQATDEIEKASRTVFLGNVSTAAIKSKESRSILMDHLASFFSDISKTENHKVVSLRFRSTAFADSSIPKKAAFAKGELMDATTKSTNAYVVYSTASAAREAVKRLNGTQVLDRHLRVDGVAHPSKVDHRRCVFVGNLGFVDDESNIKAAEEKEASSKKQSKSKAPADVEEGLWRQFKQAGSVESVRVVRDRTTRVGKGFAYVQFKDPNSIEKALLFNDKKYPPLLPRRLRVTRAKKMTKTASNLASDKRIQKPNRREADQGKPSSKFASLAGRAERLLGRAGAFQVRKRARADEKTKNSKLKSILQSPEQVVFEGHRATQRDGKGSLKLGKSGKHEKKKDRRTKRSLTHRSQARK